MASSSADALPTTSNDRLTAITRTLLCISAALTDAVAQGEPVLEPGIKCALKQLDSVLVLLRRQGATHRSQNLVKEAREALINALVDEDPLPVRVIQTINQAAGVAQAPPTILPWELVEHILSMVINIKSYNYNADEYEIGLRQRTMLSLNLVSRQFHGLMAPILKRQLHFTRLEQYERFHDDVVTKSVAACPSPANPSSSEDRDYDAIDGPRPILDFVSHSWPLAEVSPLYQTKFKWAHVLPVLQHLGSSRSLYVTFKARPDLDYDWHLQRANEMSLELEHIEGMPGVEEMRLAFDFEGESVGLFSLPMLFLSSKSLVSFHVITPHQAPPCRTRDHETMDQVDLASFEPRDWIDLVVPHCPIHLWTLLELLSGNAPNSLQSLDVTCFDGTSQDDATTLFSFRQLCARVVPTIKHLGLGIAVFPNEPPRRIICKTITETYFDRIETCQNLRYLRLGLQHYHMSTVNKRLQRLARLPLLETLVIDGPISLLRYKPATMAAPGNGLGQAQQDDAPSSICGAEDFASLLLPVLRMDRAFPRLKKLTITILYGEQLHPNFHRVCALRKTELVLIHIRHDTPWIPPAIVQTDEDSGDDDDQDDDDEDDNLNGPVE
ncbi:hypothetical protein ACM66B_003927 [Microbotryomycetes sp. NB124-2]